MPKKEFVALPSDTIALWRDDGFDPTQTGDSLSYLFPIEADQIVPIEPARAAEVTIGAPAADVLPDPARFVAEESSPAVRPSPAVESPATAAVATASTQAPGTIGAGADTLALSISENARLGRAQFTISVDGQQIGGTQTVTASTGGSQPALFEVLGNFGTSEHTVTLDFLSATGSRSTSAATLDLTSATIDGTAIGTAALQLTPGTSQSFNFEYQSATAPGAAGTARMRTSDFIATLGVNTHIGSDPYNDPTQIEQLLTYIGFQNVRQSSPIDTTSFDETQELGQLGAKIDLIINGGGPVNLSGAMQNVYELAPYLNAVENVNEVNIYPITYDGLSGVDAAVALQEDLYDAVRSDPTLDGIPVYLFTIGGADPSAFPSIPNLSAYTDYSNIQSYPPDGLLPIFVVHAAITGQQTDAPSSPVIISETGYYTLPNGVGWGGVPPDLQESFLLDEVLDEAAADVSRTYLYDLIDDGSDPTMSDQEDHFGLFNNDGTPKPSATGFHNLTTIFADPGANAATFTPTPFSYTAVGVPYNYTGNTMELDKSDGEHLIAVWNEEELWDTTTLQPLPATTFPVTVTLDNTYQTVLVYDPTISSLPIETLQNVSTVSLSLVDHPLIIDVLPNSTITPPISTTTIGSGAETLALLVSEATSSGTARFIISVDGTLVGGIEKVTASQTGGQTQAFDVLGNFGTASHTVSLDFLNGTGGGGTLYVDNATFDGAAVPGGELALAAGSAGNFAFGTPTEDTLSLDVSADAADEDAHYVVTMDGQELGGIQTATASHAAGEINVLSFSGTWGAGPHQLGLTFINDIDEDSTAAQPTLYVDAATYDGMAVGGASAALGAGDSTVIATPAAATLTLNLAGGSDQVGADFTVSVDGEQLGSAQTVTAPESAGGSEQFNFVDPLGAGLHDLAISALADAYAVGAGTLTVQSADLNGSTLPGFATTMYSGSTSHFSLYVPG